MIKAIRINRDFTPDEKVGWEKAVAETNAEREEILRKGRAVMAAKADSKKSDKFGELPPRYSLLINPYQDTRLSKCPICERPTHPRKFPLVVGIYDWGPLVLGKTCRYCSRCELVILHKDELEFELVTSMTRLAPEVIGSKYFILGTIDKKIWQQGLQNPQLRFDIRKQTADFKKYFDVEMKGGWGRD